MAFKEDQLEEATTTAENGISYKSREEAPDSNSSPVEPSWEDCVEDDEGWCEKRGPNKNPTKGVTGTKGGTVKK